MLLASSIFQPLTALFGEERKERLLHFAAAGVEMVFGFLIVVNPRSATPPLAVTASRSRPGQVPCYDTSFAPERLPRSTRERIRDKEKRSPLGGRGAFGAMDDSGDGRRRAMGGANSPGDDGRVWWARAVRIKARGAPMHQPPSQFVISV
jgi:hypothetical protein